jgi:hypothetical protein
MIAYILRTGRGQKRLYAHGGFSFCLPIAACPVAIVINLSFKRAC